MTNELELIPIYLDIAASIDLSTDISLMILGVLLYVVFMQGFRFFR